MSGREHGAAPGLGHCALLDTTIVIAREQNDDTETEGHERHERCVVVLFSRYNYRHAIPTSPSCHTARYVEVTANVQRTNAERNVRREGRFSSEFVGAPVSRSTAAFGIVDREGILSSLEKKSGTWHFEYTEMRSRTLDPRVNKPAPSTLHHCSGRRLHSKGDFVAHYWLSTRSSMPSGTGVYCQRQAKQGNISIATIVVSKSSFHKQQFLESAMRFVLFALVAAALVVAGTSGTMLKLLPTVKASLLRRVDEVKDQLRHIEHHVPNWNCHATQQRPWAKPSYQGSFSYQASAYGGLPALPLPFFPRPRPVIMLVPCRDVRTPIANFVFPCIKVVRGNEAPHAVLGSSQVGQVTSATTDGLLATTPTYGTDWTGAQQVTGVVTRAADITTTPATYEATEAATTPATVVTTTLDLATRADEFGTVTESPDTGVSAEEGSTVEPTIDRKNNMIPVHTDNPTTTTEQSPPVTPSHFNDVLKEAEAAFAKLKEH
ncbi:hypothetical protein HPB51_007156 [Rhipicephalus microplus]|uniref:Uncharacterized protein n=1 Tax=Rhipicephalus microplus TaxID=6941 RepID=A0A9J6DZX9_RHIMP|nr:hypothetical protein HPB51_007156 [Rhipicephalus microplus]